MQSNHLIYALLMVHSTVALLTSTYSIGNTPSLGPDLKSSLGISDLSSTSATLDLSLNHASSGLSITNASKAIEPSLQQYHSNVLALLSSYATPALQDSLTTSDSLLELNSSESQMKSSLYVESVVMTSSAAKTRDHTISGELKEMNESSFEMSHGHTHVIKEFPSTLIYTNAAVDFPTDSREPAFQQVWYLKSISSEHVFSTPVLNSTHQNVLAFTGFPKIDTSTEKIISRTSLEAFIRPHSKGATTPSETTDYNDARSITSRTLSATSLQGAISYFTEAITNEVKDVESTSVGLRKSSLFTKIAVCPSLFEIVGDSLYISRSVDAYVDSSESFGASLQSPYYVGASVSSSEYIDASESSPESIIASLHSSHYVGLSESYSQSIGSSVSSSESIGPWLLSSYDVGEPVSSPESIRASLSSFESVGASLQYSRYTSASLSSFESVGASLPSGASFSSFESVGASLPSGAYVSSSMPVLLSESIYAFVSSFESVDTSIRFPESIDALMSSSESVGASVDSSMYVSEPINPPSTEKTTSTLIKPTQVSGDRNIKALDKYSSTLNIEFSIKYKLNFLQDYLDSTSLAYISMRENFTQQLTTLYKTVTHFKHIDIQGFRNGSIDVDFNLVLRAFDENEDTVSPSRLREDLKDVKTKLQSQVNIDAVYLNDRYDKYVEKGVSLAESATLDGCLFQYVCDESQYVCATDIGKCVLRCRLNTHGDPASGLCKCLHGSKSGDVVSSEVECWEGVNSGHSKMRSTEIIALSVSLILAVIILMSIFTACVFQVGQNRYKKVDQEKPLKKDESQMMVQTMERPDNLHIDRELEVEFQTTEFRQNLHTDAKQANGELHQETESSHESDYPMCDTEFHQMIPDQSNAEEDVECNNLGFDWRDFAFNTRPLRLPRIAMADEIND